MGRIPSGVSPRRAGADGDWNLSGHGTELRIPEYGKPISAGADVAVVENLPMSPANIVAEEEPGMVSKNGHVKELDVRASQLDSEAGVIEDQIRGADSMDSSDAAFERGDSDDTPKLLVASVVALTHESECRSRVPYVAPNSVLLAGGIQYEGIANQGARSESPAS